MFPFYQPPPAYTGDLFGVEYLLAQSGKPFSPGEEDFDSCPDKGFEDIDYEVFAEPIVLANMEHPTTVSPPDENSEGEEEVSW